MIAYQSRDTGHTVRLENSNGDYLEADRLQLFLNFLLEPQPDKFRVVWNLEEFVAPILKRLRPEYLERLYASGQVWIKETGHSITYNPKKSLYLTLGSYRAKYYQLEQFFNGHRPKALVELKAMGEGLLSELKAIGIEPSRLSSPVALLDDELSKINYPNYEELPDEVGQMAWDCCGRSWVEAHQIGFWEQPCFDYDIISSFPSACAELLDLRYGKWIQSKVIPDNAFYGFARGSVAIKGLVSPIIYANGSGRLFSPAGRWQTTLTLHEIKFIEAFGIGSFKIEDGWWWLAKEVKVQPFKELMNRLYGHRQKSDMLNKVIKKSMVGIYGKFLQQYRDEKLADSFQPVYGAMIETQIRLKVASFILNNHLEDSLIHVSTDGCLLDKKVDLVSDEKMGSWRLDSSGPALVVSSGCLFYGDKRPNQITYPEAMEMIGKRPEESSWEKSSKRLFTIGDVIESGDLEKIGSERKIVVGFGLKNEADRDFSQLPYDGVSLLAKHYQSEPIKVSKLSKPVESQS